MTLLSDPPPARTSPARVPTRRARPSASPLLRAVAAAIASLDDVAAAPTARWHLDRMLREAVDQHLERVGEHGPVAAVPAVRVACAHLAAGDLEDAYLALLTARDLLR